mgnify:CR=1 FL=1
MLYTEKELQDTLKKDVTISKETEKRMQETYAQIRRDTKTSKKRGRKHSSMAAAVASTDRRFRREKRRLTPAMTWAFSRSTSAVSLSRFSSLPISRRTSAQWGQL